MKKLLTAAFLLLFSFGLSSCAAETRITAISVGKGDAILVESDGYACLIDAGKPEAMGKIRRALRELGIEKLDAVFLTHVDNDHAGGMAWLSKSSIEVDAWYASDFYSSYKEKNHPLVKAGAAVQWLRAGDVISAGTDAKFTVLAPIEKNEDEENDNSLVLMLETPDGRALFTGDMELPEEAELLQSGADLSCAILKVANHGDGDATGADFVSAASPQVSIISTDAYEKPGTPDPAVVARLEEAGSLIYVTQDASAIQATLSGGKASAEALAWADETHEGIDLAVDRENELFTVTNGGSETIDLTGWYLHSARGDELFSFEAATLLPGESVTVGTKSSPEMTYSAYWDEKNVLANEKDDPVALYDENGARVAYAP